MKIGELATRATVGAKTVRYYEEIGLLPVARRAENGYREYSSKDVLRLKFIRRAQLLGLSLAAIHDILVLQDTGQIPCCEVREAASRRIDEVDAMILDLQQLRDDLVELVELTAHVRVDETQKPSYCPAIAASLL